MRITGSGLIRSAGFASLLAGICYIVVGLLHPANIPASVTTARWEVVHLVACAMCFFGLLGMAGLYARQAVRAGWPGLIGYLLLSLWLVLVMGFSFVEAFILPHLAASTPSFVVSWMGMFDGPAGRFDLGVLPTVWTSTAPLYMLGGLLFGIATIRARILPRLAGALLAVSTVLAPVAGLLPNAAQPKTAVPMGIALAWLGIALWTERRTAVVLVDAAGGMYEIRVEGRLDERWSAWFDGSSVSGEADGTTLIRAEVADQAALHGLLQKVRDVGLPLISVVGASRTQPAGPPDEQRSPDVVMPGHHDRS